MNGLRTIVFSLLSLALAAFAAPGFAQNKTFTLGATGSINAGTSKTVSITFKNADTGNSSFNSVTITGTPGAVKITGASTSSAKKGTPSAFGSNSLTITDLSPTKVGATLTVTLTVSANAGDCANGTIYWSGGAWTGSPSTPSNPFTQANTDVKTTVNAAVCSVSTNVPKDAYVNQVVSTLALTPPAVPTPTALRVTVVRNGAAAADGTTVTLASLCTSGSFTSSSLSATTQSGVAEFGSLKSSTTGTGCQLTATVAGVGSSVPTAAFDVVGKLVFAPLPTSVVTGTPSTQDIVVKFVDVNGTPIPGFAGTVDLGVVVAPGSTCTLPVPTNVTAVNGVATFASLTFGGSPGPCTVKVFATIDDKYYEQTSSSFGVQAKSGLDCDPNTMPNPATVNAAALFKASDPVGALSHDSGFAEGVRGPNKSGVCVPVNWTWTNNIRGTSPSVDQLLRTVPEGGVSFVWDLASQPRATFLYTVTWKSEWVDSITGLPVGITKRCADTACTKANRVPVKTCLDTELVATSMPGGEKACTVREVRTTLHSADLDYCDGTPPAGPYPACIQVSTTFIDFDDPVLIRD
ncbi:MAG: hypothetical protein IPO75_16490 [Betaproteobacteria bacterium]|nr:hypothetical protein [Betaproteobacteria bacterium]